MATITIPSAEIRTDVESPVRSNHAHDPAARRPAVAIEQARTRSQRCEFVDFAWQVNGDDPCWCPPLKIEAHANINPRKHPFYQHGSAIQLLARRNGHVVGRVSVSDDPRYNAEHESNTGCFGMFEAIDDVEVARALLGAAASWLRTRGRTEMLGPIDYSTNYPSGLLIDGFDTPQRVMMNHNPKYYSQLLESCGLHKAKDMHAWWFDANNPDLEGWLSRAERIAARGGVTIRPLRVADIDNEINRCMQVYNQTWQKTWGFVQMTPEEFRHMGHQLKQTAVPELLMLAEVAGQPVGFSVTLPDINEAIRPMGGRLTHWGLPIGLVQLLRGMKHIKTARMAVLGVLPGYRKRGIAELMIMKTFQYGKHQLGYTGAELGWTLEDNDLINRTVESVGARRYKRFRIYQRAL
jgi:GNAT superfamily N-acetyltransferase